MRKKTNGEPEMKQRKYIVLVQIITPVGLAGLICRNLDLEIRRSASVLSVVRPLVFVLEKPKIDEWCSVEENKCITLSPITEKLERGFPNKNGNECRRIIIKYVDLILDCKVPFP